MTGHGWVRVHCSSPIASLVAWRVTTHGVTVGLDQSISAPNGLACVVIDAQVRSAALAADWRVEANVPVVEGQVTYVEIPIPRL